MGAELIGDDSVLADAEMICVVIESLINGGLKEFQVSIGQVEYFKGICEEAGLDEDTEAELREFIANKNYFGAEALLAERGVLECYSKVLLKITEMFGSVESLSEAKELVQNNRSLQAIERLEKLYQLLGVYGVESYVSFDLGMLNNYNYYTGVTFKAYTYGVGDAIVTGGRYDNLLRRFGKDAPAIGFMILIDDLMNALFRQGLLPPIEEKNIVLNYQKDNFTEVLTKAMEMRAKGIKVELIAQEKGGDLYA